MKPKISACTSRAATYWDHRTCQCKLKKTAHDCIAASEEARDSLEYRTVDIICYTFLGSCLTMSIFLACTTWQYRKKLMMVEEKDHDPGILGCTLYNNQVHEGLEREVTVPSDGGPTVDDYYGHKLKIFGESE